MNLYKLRTIDNTNYRSIIRKIGKERHSNLALFLLIIDQSPSFWNRGLLVKKEKILFLAIWNREDFQKYRSYY